MGVPLSQLWSVIAVSPLTYVRDTANALVRMVHADALPNRVYNLSSGYTTSAREQLLTLYRIRPDAAQQVNLDPSANASGGAVSVERLQRGSTEPRHRVASPIHIRRSAWRLSEGAQRTPILSLKHEAALMGQRSKVRQVHEICTSLPGSERKTQGVASA